MEIAELVPFILVVLAILVGGGGIAAYIKARNEGPKFMAETQSIIIRNLQDEVKRLDQGNKELRKAREADATRIANLEDEMRILKKQVNGV